MGLLAHFWWAWIGPVGWWLWLALETEKTAVRCTQCRTYLGQATKKEDQKGTIRCRECAR